MPLSRAEPGTRVARGPTMPVIPRSDSSLDRNALPPAECRRVLNLSRKNRMAPSALSIHEQEKPYRTFCTLVQEAGRIDRDPAAGDFL